MSALASIKLTAAWADVSGAMVSGKKYKLASWVREPRNARDVDAGYAARVHVAERATAPVDVTSREELKPDGEIVYAFTGVPIWARCGCVDARIEIAEVV